MCSLPSLHLHLVSLPPLQANQQMYFVSESALFELFRYAAVYSDALLEALDEEGLTSMAHSFETIKDSLQLPPH